MIIKVLLGGGEYLYRNVAARKDIRKIAKSIHSHFPETDYPSLEGKIFNEFVKETRALTLYPPYDNKPPIAQQEEQAPYKG